MLTQPPTLAADLQKDGLSQDQADALLVAYGQQPDFIAGMAAVVMLLALDEIPDQRPPQGEPWSSIWDNCSKDLTRKGEIFADFIKTLPADLANTLSQVVETKVRNKQAWWVSIKTGNNANKSPEFYMQILQHFGYRFRLNRCTDKIECNGNQMNDYIAAEIRAKVRSAGIKEVAAVEDAYTADAYRHRYHPIQNYLERLKWDGVEHIENLTGFFADDKRMFPEFLKRWLIGAVAKSYQPVRTRVLVLDGEQEIGKSRFVAWLASPMLEYFQEGPVAPENKDHRILLMSKWVWEVSEWGTVARRADREALKAFLTQQYVNERGAYRKHETSGPAITSFIATGNNEMGFFNDPTGSSRFMTCHIKKIDWQGYTREIDVDQVWAQAYQLYINGESHELSLSERVRASEINAEYQVMDLVEETINQLFDVQPGNRLYWTSSLNILNHLKQKGDLKAGIEIDVRKLASALTKMGLGKPGQRSIAGVNVRGYYGISIKL
jgi:predicted P-loop ATPase